jgi:hypothetical protein
LTFYQLNKLNDKNQKTAQLRDEIRKDYHPVKSAKKKNEERASNKKASRLNHGLWTQR